MGPAPACPRCAYDLTGSVTSWTLSCPTRGLCPECGLPFEWPDLLSPSRQDLPGFSEHARRGRRLRWAIVTFSWIILPRRFWTRVKLHHRLHVERAARSILLLALLLHLATGLFLLCRYMLEFGRPAPSELVRCFFVPFDFPNAFLPTSRIPLLPGIPIGFARLPILHNTSSWLPTLAAVLSHAAWPLLLLAVPSSRRLAKVRWAHVARAVVHPFLWLAAMQALWLFGLAAESASTLLDKLGGGASSDVAASLFNQLASACASVWNARGEFLIVWVAAWWYSTLSRGWKLDRAALLWLALQVAVALAVANVLVVRWWIAASLRQP
jgi:hypothetical protein